MNILEKVLFFLLALGAVSIISFTCWALYMYPSCEPLGW